MLITLTTFPLFAASENDLRFAVVPKFYGMFFDQSKNGCKDAAAEIEGVECVYRGPEKASVRIQNRIIEQLIDEGVDGIAVAVTQSKFLAENSLQKAKQAGIPVIRVLCIFVRKYTLGQRGYSSYTIISMRFPQE